MSVYSGEHERQAERMVLSARSRSVLVVAPIVSALLAIAVIGSAVPEWIEPGIPSGVLAAVVAVVGAAAAVLVTSGAVSTRGRVRTGWGIGAAVPVLGAGVVAGYLLGWPGWLVWGVLRGLLFVTHVATGVLLQRGLGRTRREWALLLLDGWLVAASVFMITWVALTATGSPADADVLSRPALYWIAADLLTSSAVAGLAMRARAQVRGQVLLSVLVALLGLTIDITWALTGVPHFGALLWIVQMATLVASTMLGRLDLWGRRTPSGSSPPLLRLPQWAIVPGLIAAVVPVGDPIVVLAAVSVILGLAAELAMTGRQNNRLWRTLHSQAQHFDQLLRESRDAIVHVDAAGHVRFANDALSDVLGYSRDDVLGRRAITLVHPDDRDRIVSEVTRLGVDDGVAGGRVSGRFRHADGSWRTFEATVSRRSGGEAGYTLSARDVSERVTLEQELRRLAHTDALTSLLNRPAFLSVLEERLREGGPATVLFVDLDGFKTVNDMDGHAVGDRLLREVAETLRRELRGPDVAARLGGDEFAVLLGTDRVDEARAVADRLVQRLRRMPSDPARRTAASVGVATGQNVSAEVLLGDADLAMYEAKARGGRRLVVFEPWMRERITERARMSLALQQACEGEGLLLDVQPIVDLEKDNAWVGFEALARWQDGVQRREPHEFLPVAEESGLIDPIGRWVLNRALVWLARWPDHAAGVSVNVAGSQLATVGFGDWVHQQLAGLGISPDRLTLEISERTALGDLQRATTVLQPLRALGVRIALDDFGTGFSSFGHIADLPVDELKIDRRFVTGLGRRPRDEAVVRTVCQLAHDLGLRVVAEGVETQAQASTLRDHGCQLGQGFLFRPPTPIGELELPVPDETAARNGRSTGWPTDPHSRAS